MMIGGRANVVKKAVAPARRSGSLRLNSSNETAQILKNDFPVIRGINLIIKNMRWIQQVKNLTDKPQECYRTGKQALLLAIIL
jgi:hypothetical protein